MKKRLILGSSSKPRQFLLQRLQLPFQIASPDIDESPFANEDPKELVLRLAKEKALAVSASFPDALIIGADQVGILNDKIVGKPLHHEKAFEQLSEASGKLMRFYIGLCLLDAATQETQLALEEFDVRFRTLSENQIEQYLRKEQPYQSAGSCNAEGLGIALIEEFQGKDFTALIGLPLIRLVAMLEKAGLNPLT